MSVGVFAVSRNIFEHDLFDPEPFTEREAWIWMIREAAWKDRRIRFGKMHGSIKRGQMASSVRFMAEKWQWSKSRVHRFLGRLEEERMIECGTAQGHSASVITICNYDEYQRVSLPEKLEDGTAAGQQRDSSGTNKNTGENNSNTGEGIPLRGPSAMPAKSLDAQVYAYGREVLGKSAGGVITELRRLCGDDNAALAWLSQAAEKDQPVVWLKAVIRNSDAGSKAWRGCSNFSGLPIPEIETRAEREERKRYDDIWAGVL